MRHSNCLGAQVQQADNYSVIMGLPPGWIIMELPKPPALEMKTIGKMGLKNVPGLRINPVQGGGRGDAQGGGGGGFRQYFGGGAAGPPRLQRQQQTPRLQQPQQRGGRGRPNTAR